MTCRPCLASGASLACSRARTPRSRSCGRRSVGTGKAAHVGVRRDIRLLLRVSRRDAIEQCAGCCDVVSAIGVGKERGANAARGGLVA